MYDVEDKAKDLVKDTKETPKMGDIVNYIINEAKKYGGEGKVQRERINGTVRYIGDDYEGLDVIVEYFAMLMSENSE